MDGKLVVLTGATSGIGRAAAIALAAEGARLALVYRSRERAEAVVDAVRARAGRADVTLHRADLSVQAEVRAAAQELVDAHPRIDVLVNNAGIVSTSLRRTTDGIEETFATNHLAYVLLTLSLLPRLRASAPARIVNVASEAHRLGRIDLDHLDHPEGAAGYGWGLRAYGTSKLANVLFTRELARRLSGTGVTVHCLHPGAVGTGLARQNGRFARTVTTLLRPFFRTPEAGADTLVWLASSPDAERTTGGYWYDRRPLEPSAAARDPALAARVWSESLRLVGLAGQEAAC